MKLQVWFVLIMALVGIGCCEGAEQDNIFHVHYEENISLGKLERKLGETPFKMEAGTVAGYLAQTVPKDRKYGPIGYFSVDDLLKLAEINTEKPMDTCERVQFLALIRMCDEFAPYENVNAVRHHLSGYCKQSIKKRFEFCASQLGKINDLTDKKILFGDVIMEFSKKFSDWMEYDGDENRTLRDNIINYRWSWSCPRKQIADSCSIFNKLLEANLLFFDEDGKKTSAYFAADKEAFLMKERCKIFVEEAKAERERRKGENRGRE